MGLHRRSPPYSLRPLDSRYSTPCCSACPSAFFSGCLILLATYLAFKTREKRTCIVALCQIGTVVEALLLWLLPRSAKGGLLYGLCSLSSFASAHSTLMGVQLANTAGYTKRSLASSGIFIGFCFGMYPKNPPIQPRPA
jgi:hypothetical protein